MSFLALRGVTMRYGAVVAVDAVDLVIAAGTRTAIVGPSGCGKTTLLRLIGGFERPVEGVITLREQVLADSYGAVPAHLRNIGYVTQDGALFPHLSVSANIGFGLPRDEPDRAERIVGLMQAVGLPARLGERRPHELSGGQQQRVALARALARQPAIMLLDEPFSALDAGLRDSMREMVGEVLGSAGVTTILVTHDQTEALSFADHLVVMREGKLVQAGAPADLYDHPTDPQTASFLGDAIILDADLADGFADCALGRIAVIDGSRRGEARIMLRPEQVAVHPLLDGMMPAGASIIGKVVGQSFRGPTRKLVVEFSGSASTGTATQAVRRLTFLTLNSASPPVGSSVRVEVVSPAHVFS